MRFEGKVVFVTGGASGLGAATARRFANEGAKVVIADLDIEGAAGVARSLPDALPVTLDTADPASVERGIAEAREFYGRIDVIFNNAGIASAQYPLHEMELDAWDRVVRVDGYGVFYVLKYGIEVMLRSGGGAIINTASTTALAAQRDISPYIFAKAGVVGLTRSAAIEYADRGIRVNAIAPTVVMTPLVERFIEAAPNPGEMRERMTSVSPKPGIPAPEDIAGVVAFLASADASWITGHTIPIDGGFVAR